MKIYRYVTNNEGVWSAGKRLLPSELIDEVNKNRSWLKKPDLPDGNFRFWMTDNGNSKYLDTLYKSHTKYLPNIEVIESDSSELGKIVYEDEHQIVDELG